MCSNSQEEGRLGFTIPSTTVLGHQVPLPVFYPLRRQGMGPTVIRRRWGEGEGRGSNESRKFQGMTELGVQAMSTMTHPSSPSRSPKGGRRPPRKGSPCAERLF